MINKSNNPKENVKKAVALSYNSDDDAPKVIAKGEGLVAENIVKRLWNLIFQFMKIKILLII